VGRERALFSADGWPTGMADRPMAPPYRGSLDQQEQGGSPVPISPGAKEATSRLPCAMSPGSSQRLVDGGKVADHRRGTSSQREIHVEGHRTNGPGAGQPSIRPSFGAPELAVIPEMAAPPRRWLCGIAQTHRWLLQPGRLQPPMAALRGWPKGPRASTLRIGPAMEPG
jgi:hypothetical protein